MAYKLMIGEDVKRRKLFCDMLKIYKIPILVFINKDLLGNSHVHLFMYCS